MKTWTISRIRQTASSLVLVLVVSAVGVLLVSGVLSWMNTNSRLTDRLNQYDKSVAAAAAATEKIISHLTRDFQVGGDSNVINRLPVYRGIVPTGDEDRGLGDSLTGVLGGILGGNTSSSTTVPKPIWTAFEFRDHLGQLNQTGVDQIASWQYTNISSRFPGLMGYCATYRVSSTAKTLNSHYNTTATVNQEVQVASVPIFSYQVLYVPDLEINPSTAMTFSGRIHCNGSVYAQGAGALTFNRPVTAARRVLHQKHPLDPSARTAPVVSYAGGREMGVNSLSLSLGTNVSLRTILQIPPSSESRSSALGSQRLYNRADLIILISNTTCVARSGAYNDFSITIPWAVFDEVKDLDAGKSFPGKGKAKVKLPKLFGNPYVYEGIINTNMTFFDARENKTIRGTEIDIHQLNRHMAYLTSVLGRPVKTLYVADMRSQTLLSQSGVRIIFGQTLTNALTIATPNPLYVLGPYNAPEADLGTTNTSGAVPAALMADAITILSQEWEDRYSTTNLTWRVATNVTINAALLGGIVPSDGYYYSGGVENFPRLLEDWTGYTLTLNGSMVALFPSAIARSPWGARPGIYNPPAARKWSFDSRLSTLTGLPPSTPHARTVIRWRAEVVHPST